MSVKHILACAVVATAVASAQAGTVQLITNGNFETGSTAGWTAASTGGQKFNAIGNGANVPYSGHAVQVNGAGGNYVAVSDQTGGSGQALLQSFTKAAGVQSLILQFDWFDNTHSAFNGAAIDGSQQVGRVDILTAAAGTWDVSSGVVQNLLLNAGSFTNFGTTIPWQHASFDLSGLAAGTYQLRFANGQNAFYQEFGVDNVQLSAEVPEPSSIALLGLGLLCAGVIRRKSAKK
jgi:hypothetical protein